MAILGLDRIFNYDPYNGDSGSGDFGSSVPGNPAHRKNVLKISSMQNIFGAPYQFMETVDRRMYNGESESSSTSSQLGRKYTEKIVARLPLLMLTPCRQKFMEGFSRDQRANVMSALIGGVNNPSAFDDYGRYYSVEFKYDEYYNCVRRMVNQAAYLLGVHNTRVNLGGSRTAIKDINWMQVGNPAFRNYFAASNSVVFYVDGLTTMQDSFSNNTTDSSLASTINGISDTAREIQFLVGPNSAASHIYNMTRDAVNEAAGSIESMTGTMVGGMLGDLTTTGVNAVLSGGKMIFPKIWSDSSFSRSYSFDIKLRSPDHDSLSIFLNIIVPYLHLLALVMPQSLTEGEAAQSPNAYQTPFLLKAYCKGMFNIDMGVITDLSVTRGAESQWNNDGLPTQMDISISIEDLYSALFMTNPKGNPLSNNFDIVANTAMLDYLSNLVGLNVAAEQVGRRAKMFVAMTGNDITTFGPRVFNTLDNTASNLFGKLYRKIH